MKLYIDSSDAQKIAELNGILEIAGVTTNPSILASAGREPKDVIRDIISILTPVQKLFVQSVQTDFQGIMAEARQIAALRPDNAYVKIPVTPDGFRAMRQCRKEGIKVLATAVFSAEQGLLAALNGAECIAPYVNRMCNYTDGIAEVIDLSAMLKSTSPDTEIIAASFKNVNQIHALAKAGIDSATVPCDLIFRMISHVGTDEAVEGFTTIWRKSFGRDTLF